MSDSQKHTPGPWRVETRDNEVQIWSHRVNGGMTSRVCVAVINGDADKTPEAETDALLIAAAPALLELLQRGLIAVDVLEAEAEALRTMADDLCLADILHAQAQAEAAEAAERRAQEALARVLRAVSVRMRYPKPESLGARLKRIEAVAAQVERDARGSA